jgi:EAL and modified HD-GYP domain-containing signal transduction protein
VTSTPAFWLARQPILDLTGDTVAYELLFRSDAGNAARVTDARMATASVISSAFGELGMASVLGDCNAFINFDAELLMSDVVELLPSGRTVIEILETVVITPQIVERCRELRARGFSFALDDVVQLDDSYEPLLPLVDILKLDVLATAQAELPGLVARARAAKHVKLLAEKVDSREQAERCRKLGFELFARPVGLKGRRADPSKRMLMQLLEQTLDDATDTAVLQETFKQAPELSYKLMRLVNSVGTGLRSPIQSLSHALTILGRRQLQRWLQLLLFAQQGTGKFPSPLLETAAARGKLMELLAEQRSPDPRWCDRAFMTGILSLIDTLLETPMAEVVEDLRLPDDVRAALLERSGPLGHFLRIVEALEQVDDTSVSALLADRDPCSTAELPQLQIAALSWSTGLGHAGESPQTPAKRRQQG